ncbi:2-amino-4-hydroxy-6-hydroxymethyldihydropteridine diphosphokinase [Clostridium sp. C105KSO13]|uniref:2-amino-4-hydroxy-6- hydroxymethyldihydropteridine diphosphokinase n=1 Tax=Clostridium sp. C105KSO13 TaxID=1776045 RepID=UPI0007406195|nr:2-amino-4-hydroxy-6-hydroxymethyldihydropteridine diphosphokinase [Clostridium sp. C105KSO13]CUX43114.1 Bifunctional folate synthesis protein [Clostridium sp. C105KSO13]
MDRINIENLEVFANHGVFPEENVLGQKFLVSVTLYTNTRHAGQTDDLKASIHYGEVSRFITDYMKKHTYKLIERAAESLAEALLLGTKHLEKVELELKKPWAPVGLPVEYVSVKIIRQWHTAYVALGSNMGDKQKYLEDAVKALHEARGCYVTKTSSWLVTPPYGRIQQDDFLNGCLELKTLLSPEELLGTLHKIEQDAGRERTIHWGPRTLDLDILFYDDLILGTDTLCIPHADLQNRDFVLRPLEEIAPYKHHPGNGKTVREMLAGLG